MSPWSVVVGLASGGGGTQGGRSVAEADRRPPPPEAPRAAASSSGAHCQSVACARDDWSRVCIPCAAPLAQQPVWFSHVLDAQPVPATAASPRHAPVARSRPAVAARLLSCLPDSALRGFCPIDTICPHRPRSSPVAPRARFPNSDFRSSLWARLGAR